MREAFYNEIDPFVAQWLRNLIDAGHIERGYVDERDIRVIKPRELTEYQQVHLFAGIGVWSHALQQAGWPREIPVWTGSCPCQPFSDAGKRKGVADERHLWPEMFRLICECKPDFIFGEQVAGADGLAWFDVVSTDLENEGYTVGAADTCLAGLGAPEIRQRLYWMAYFGKSGLQGWGVSRNSKRERVTREDCVAGRLAHPSCEREGGRRIQRSGKSQKESIGQKRKRSAGLRTTCGLANPELHGPNEYEITRSFGSGKKERRVLQPKGCTAQSFVQSKPGPTNGYWRNADWLFCTDGFWRPVEPGTFPLVNGITGRVGQVRAYGNAIAVPQAQVFIEAVMDILGIARVGVQTQED